MHRILRRIQIHPGHKKSWILAICAMLYTIRLRNFPRKLILFMCPDRILILREQCSSVKVSYFWKRFFEWATTIFVLSLPTANQKYVNSGGKPPNTASPCDSRRILIDCDGYSCVLVTISGSMERPRPSPSIRAVGRWPNGQQYCLCTSEGSQWPTLHKSATLYSLFS